MYQSVLDKKHKRGEHVWYNDPKRDLYKCVLCGAVTHFRPPDVPTPADWLPEKFELPLTKDERALAPYIKG